MIGIFAQSFMTATRQQTPFDRRHRWDAPTNWHEDCVPDAQRRQKAGQSDD